ncbi:restriction endonuclease subunit S [Yoonia sp. R2-816]|uniref:restriction endonuclease subunit S n=1 Tax=Yoonia sp. R2-816 TaxID=3342638 RepID=UPI00372C875B
MKAGWDVKPLGEVCELVNGRAYKKPELLDQGKYPVLRVGNFFTSNKWYYSDLELEPKKYCETGDLLYAWSASFGPRIWEGEKSIFHYHIWNVQHPEQKLDRKFLYYYFDWDKERIKEEQGAGATMIHVSKHSMEARALPIPPLEEQKRIVAVLDAAFEGLTRAKENAEANLQNARELFDNFVEGYFRELSQRYKPKPLLDVCRERGITYGVIKLGDQIDDGVPCLRTSNVRSLSFTLEGMKSISTKLSKEYSRTILRGGEVLVNVRGTLGGVTVVPSTMSGWNISREVAMVDVNDQEAVPDYVALFIASKTAQSWLTGVTTGAAYKGINLADLRKLPMPLPDKGQQIASINILNAIKDKVLVAEANYLTKLTDIVDLRQSLLQKAFAGELT